MECWVTDQQMCRPDLAIYTDAQIRLMAVGTKQIPTFVIEVTSSYNYYNKGMKKLREYFAAGVQMAWYIFPEEKVVYAYTSPKHVTICSDVDVLPVTPYYCQ